jgi:heme/copper-type cytochrome/quinol oxidase subunit 3
MQVANPRGIYPAGKHQNWHQSVMGVWIIASVIIGHFCILIAVTGMQQFRARGAPLQKAKWVGGSCIFAARENLSWSTIRTSLLAVSSTPVTAECLDMRP